MKGTSRLFISGAIIASVGLGTVVPAAAVAPSRPVHVAVPRNLFNPTRSWPLSIRALIARIFQEECAVFPALCAFVPPPVTTTTTVPHVTPTTAPTTSTTVPATTSTTSSPTVVTLPVVITLPAMPFTSTCTIMTVGQGGAVCSQSASVSSVSSG
jgi:hypothetical protein